MSAGKHLVLLSQSEGTDMDMQTSNYKDTRVYEGIFQNINQKIIQKGLV